jgi:hypothetical protein
MELTSVPLQFDGAGKADRTRPDDDGIARLARSRWHPPILPVRFEALRLVAED